MDIKPYFIRFLPQYKVKKVWWPYVTLFACIFSGLRADPYSLDTDTDPMRIRIQCGSGSRGFDDQNKFTCEKN